MGALTINLIGGPLNLLLLLLEAEPESSLLELPHPATAIAASPRAPSNCHLLILHSFVDTN
ncbi:MAG TPA: hypothetical protein VI318_12910 [Baekduia sp.]